MAYQAGIPIRQQIHSETATGSGVWQDYRAELTGRFLSGSGITGYQGVDLAYHDMREFNRQVDTMTGLWNTTGLFLAPFNAGYSYTGDTKFVTFP
mgnify:CR=1 FL=1|jgi:hypothetical protein